MKLASNEYIQNYDQDDRYKWSKFVRDLVGDCWFAVPAIEHALMHSGNAMVAEKKSTFCLYAH